MIHSDSLARAAASLEGLALGDAFGDRLFFDNYSFQRSPDEVIMARNGRRRSCEPRRGGQRSY